MQNQSPAAVAAVSIRTASAKHAKAGRPPVSAAAKRVIITALLLSGLTASSVAIVGHAGGDQISGRGQTHAKYALNTPFMY